jgi:hypothetical protein
MGADSLDDPKRPHAGDETAMSAMKAGVAAVSTNVLGHFAVKAAARQIAELQ